MNESLRYLLDRAALVEDRIRTLVAHRRSHDPAPEDPFRGLYLSDEMAASLVTEAPPPPRPEPHERARVEQRADTDEAAGDRIRLRWLSRAAGLSAEDVELLVICLLPDLDSRFERLYGYLNDDVTRRRATIGLALALADLSPLTAAARARFSAGAPLVDHALVLVEDSDRPFLTRGLRVPDRVTGHLLGNDTPDPALSGVLTDIRGHAAEQSSQISHALGTGQQLIYVRETFGCAGVSLGVAALEAAGKEPVCVDAERLAASPDALDVVRVLGREALLRDGGVVVAPVDALGARATEIIAALGKLLTPVVLAGIATWDPRWSAVVPLQIDAKRLTHAERSGLWSLAMNGSAEEVDVADIAAEFVLGPSEVARAVQAAESSALLTDNRVTAEQLRRGARSQNAAGLERLSRRIEPGVSWSDIVLPDKVLEQLRELASRARHRDRVLTDWRMRPGGGRGIGVTALFAGDSGTGKTMAAEVIAGELGLDLYAVNLASVVDKYVGETEKNLERIFAEAGGVNGVLLFDEADAIFGKRSEVRDAHDRYANIETAYLLQRMETFDGLAVLATNLRANLDEAFTRRLDMVVDFPSPDEPSRRALWTQCFAAPVPCRGDLDFEYLAGSFVLSGGNIRSASVSAAYLAAAAGGTIGMAEVITAVRQEYRKLGRLMPSFEPGR